VFITTFLSLATIKRLRRISWRSLPTSRLATSILPSTIPCGFGPADLGSDHITRSDGPLLIFMWPGAVWYTAWYIKPTCVSSFHYRFVAADGNWTNAVLVVGWRKTRLEHRKNIDVTIGFDGEADRAYLLYAFHVDINGTTIFCPRSKYGGVICWWWTGDRALSILVGCNGKHSQHIFG
jgi:hypothetical protein